MNATAVDARVQADATTCFHCREPVPAHAPRVEIDGATRAFCCDGCAAAARWIRDARLDDYYRLRSDAAARVERNDDDFASWDRDDLLATHARDIPGGRELVLLTDGMRCAACAWLIDRALTREPGVLEVSANAITGRIRIAWDPTRTKLSAPLRRLQSLGYRPWLAAGIEREAERVKARNRALVRLGVAGLGAVQAMMFTEALYLDTAHAMSIPMRDFLRWIAFLIATPVVFWSGAPFIAGFLREVRERRLGADTLVAISTLLAYFASVYETLTGGPHVWYDAAVMFVFLLLGARMLEQRARSAAVARIDVLARARPAFAVRERADGTRETIAMEALAADDIACVAAGDAVPADGVLLDKQAWFEEALLTGESRPVRKSTGDAVFAGTACREVPARVRITAVGAATRLSQLVALVDRAQAHRPAIARLADRVAMGFVVAMLVVSAILYAVWSTIAPDRALDVVLALLVISCPCALSLAIPAALAAANGTLARDGVLPITADALERLARVTDVVFDKTGTLGDAVPALGVVMTFGIEREIALRHAAALERDSRHPLAVMFAPFARDSIFASDVRSVPGQGVRGRIDGVEWRIGQARFAAGREDDGALWLGDGTQAFARFETHEAPRWDARATIDNLRAQGLQVHLCSGDGDRAVARFAEALAIRDAHARQSPDDKLARVRALQAEGRVVAMVGDGINDAPVLAGADVSIAIGDGAALAQRSADLVLATPVLSRIGDALALARDTRRIVRQNLGWAVAWNLVALPIAAFGLVTPWLAALGMALSSLTVTLNALRLGRRRNGVIA